MSTHRAVVLHSTSSPLSLEAVETPVPTSGQVVIKVLATSIVHYLRHLITGKIPYPLALPMVPGANTIGRVEAVGPDATHISPGQLVLVDPTIRARDDVGGEQGTSLLLGLTAGITPNSHKLAENGWRHGALAERMLIPLENANVLDEDVLVKQKGYPYSRLVWISTMAVPYGGWEAADLRPGETAIVAFATGYFGSAAIHVAIAMGAGRVVAVGRNIDTLRKVQDNFGADKVSVVAIKGDVSEDGAALRAATLRGAGADCFLDLSPPAAGEGASTHIQAALSALKCGGRAVLMGGVDKNISIPYQQVMLRNLKITGRFMYDREATARLIRLVESGRLSLERFRSEEYVLDEFELAIDRAESVADRSTVVTVIPQLQ